MIDLDQGPCVIKRLKGCGCGNEYVAVTPDGDIFPCHQFVGNDQWKMGNVMDGSFNFPMKADFAEANIYHKPLCKDCWAKFFCSGDVMQITLSIAAVFLTPIRCPVSLKKNGWNAPL